MFEAPTLFVLGAGSSAEVHLPVGTTLLERVANALDMNLSKRESLTPAQVQLFTALSQIQSDLTPFLYTGRRLKTAVHLTPSIDTYMDQHQHDSELQIAAKLAITREILQAECDSVLYDPDPDTLPEFSSLDKTWFVKFFKRLADRIPAKDLNGLFANVAFITFNYDRCLEHFLFNAIRGLYHLKLDAAKTLFRAARIYHPYGTVGALPWMDDELKVAFGGVSCTPQTLFALSRGIHTFTERLKEVTLVQKLHKEVREARTIVFLGFSYQKQNIELIRPESFHPELQVFGTGHGISQPDCQTITRKIHLMTHRVPGAITIRAGLTCTQLFDQYAQSL